VAFGPARSHIRMLCKLVSTYIFYNFNVLKLMYLHGVLYEHCYVIEIVGGCLVVSGDYAGGMESGCMGGIGQYLY